MGSFGKKKKKRVTLWNGNIEKVIKGKQEQCKAFLSANIEDDNTEYRHKRAIAKQEAAINRTPELEGMFI